MKELVCHPDHSRPSPVCCCCLLLSCMRACASGGVRRASRTGVARSRRCGESRCGACLRAFFFCCHHCSWLTHPSKHNCCCCCSPCGVVYCCCCRAILPLLAALGATLAPVRGDIQGNINKLQKAYDADPQNRTTLQALIQHEIDAYVCVCVLL